MTVEIIAKGNKLIAIAENKNFPRHFNSESELNEYLNSLKNKYKTVKVCYDGTRTELLDTITINNTQIKSISDFVKLIANKDKHYTLSLCNEFRNRIDNGRPSLDLVRVLSVCDKVSGAIVFGKHHDINKSYRLLKKRYHY